MRKMMLESCYVDKHMGEKVGHYRLSIKHECAVVEKQGWKGSQESNLFKTGSS